MTLRDTPAAAGVDVRAALLGFHKRYYSANQMKLVIMGAAPVSELREWATGMFSGVPNTGAAKAIPPPTGAALELCTLHTRRNRVGICHTWWDMRVRAPSCPV